MFQAGVWRSNVNGNSGVYSIEAAISVPQLEGGTRMITVPSRQPADRPRPFSAGSPLTVSIGLAVSALVLTAILLTAAASSLLWWRTAEATSRQLASTINEQIVAAVRKEVSAIVSEAVAAHTAVRTLFLQNVLDTREADQRDVVFLSHRQAQAGLPWLPFGCP